MKIFSTRMYVAVGLTAIVTSAVVLAMFLGLVPDPASAQRQARVSLAETVAASATALLTAGEERRIEPVLRFVMNRNPEVLSAAVRERGGRVVAAAGGAAGHRGAGGGGVSAGNPPVG